MKDIIHDLEDLINFITYDDAAQLAGEPVPNEIRELLVEILEVTKKALFFMYNKPYETKKPFINPQDTGYQTRQLIYYLDSNKKLNFKGNPLIQPVRQSIKEELVKAVETVQKRSH